MKKIKYYFISLLLVSVFTACTPPLKNHEARTIVFKTPKLAYADAGFVYDNGSDVKVEIFIAGHPVFTLELDRKICLDGYCFKKKDFITKYLNSDYDEDILHQIFLGKKIFDSEGLSLEPDGFSQTIFKKSSYQISYKVTHDTIRFRDKISKILIKIKKLS